MEHLAGMLAGEQGQEGIVSPRTLTELRANADALRHIIQQLPASSLNRRSVERQLADIERQIDKKEHK